jgi:hypothetical protein
VDRVEAALGESVAVDDDGVKVAEAVVEGQVGDGNRRAAEESGKDLFLITVNDSDQELDLG